MNGHAFAEDVEDMPPDLRLSKGECWATGGYPVVYMTLVFVVHRQVHERNVRTRVPGRTHATRKGRAAGRKEQAPDKDFEYWAPGTPIGRAPGFGRRYAAN